MARLKSTSNIITVNTTANRSKRYKVEFDKGDGSVISVSSVFRRGSDYGDCARVIWHRRFGRQISITAKCAVNAAVCDLAKKIPLDQLIGVAILAGMEIER